MSALNRAKGTQAPVKGKGSSGSNTTKAATKGSPLPKGYGQQRSADLEGNYQRGKRVGSGGKPASGARVRK
jgi:hypothetical protein